MDQRGLRQRLLQGNWLNLYDVSLYKQSSTVRDMYKIVPMCGSDVCNLKILEGLLLVDRCAVACKTHLKI